MRPWPMVGQPILYWSSSPPWFLRSPFPANTTEAHRSTRSVPPAAAKAHHHLHHKHPSSSIITMTTNPTPQMADLTISRVC